MKNEKIKVESLEIIVTGKREKPYFEIKYKEVGKRDYNIGYSSYDLNNVFVWRDECFQVVTKRKIYFRDYLKIVRLWFFRQGLERMKGVKCKRLN